MGVRSDLDVAHAGEQAAIADAAATQPAFLATATANRQQRRFAAVLVAVSAVLFLVAIPFAKVELARVDAFVPILQSSLIIIDLVTAVLLLGQFVKLRSRAILALAAGYLFDALIIVPYMLAFPGVFAPGGVIGGGPQTSAWLYTLWHALFPLFVIAYALMKDERSPVPDAKTAQAWALAAASLVVVLVTALIILVTAGHDRLPSLIQGTRSEPITHFFIGAASALSIVAVAALWWRGIRTVLDVWVAVVMCAWVFDVALGGVFTGGRFDLGWYAGRGYGLMAASFVLIVLLLETSGLLSRLVEVTAELRGETVKLKGDVRHSVARQQEIEAQLRQAVKMEAIGNLTGGMAHDFNNLLAIVIGNLDMLVDRKKADAEVQELGREALDAALLGADLTRRLLAFARRQPLQPQLVALNELIGAHTKLLRRLLGETVEVALELSPDVWPTEVDPGQLESVLTNLATNARDAMPKGGRLTIVTANRHLDADYAALHPEVAPGDYAAIEVSDTGSGIEPDVLPRVFEPFFTTKGHGKGSGLGLSMIYGFMKQTKGHVNVYSEPGVGTTFRLYLPRAAEQSVADGKAIAKAEEERGHGETVLAVEDVPQLRRLVVRQLVELGYRVVEADSAAAALAILERQPVDLLFTDIIIAGRGTGFDLAGVARARWPKLGVVFTSGFADATLTNGNGKPLPGRLLTKPYRREDLARALREALGAKSET